MVDIIYVVKGHGEFPVDMLRYDRSCPYSESDSYLIRNSVSSTRAGRDEYEVTLIRLNAHKGWTPGAPRWASFGWTVTTR